MIPKETVPGRLHYYSRDRTKKCQISHLNPIQTRTLTPTLTHQPVCQWIKVPMGIPPPQVQIPSFLSTGTQHINNHPNLKIKKNSPY